MSPKNSNNSTTSSLNHHHLHARRPSSFGGAFDVLNATSNGGGNGVGGGKGVAHTSSRRSASEMGKLKRLNVSNTNISSQALLDLFHQAIQLNTTTNTANTATSNTTTNSGGDSVGYGYAGKVHLTALQFGNSDKDQDHEQQVWTDPCLVLGTKLSSRWI
jgi:hypothetical protein